MCTKLSGKSTERVYGLDTVGESAVGEGEDVLVGGGAKALLTEAGNLADGMLGVGRKREKTL